MNDSSTSQRLMANQAITILFVSCFLAFLLCVVFGYLAVRGIKKQEKEVDSYMEPVIHYGLLHTEKDFKDCAKQKSNYLFHKRTRILFPILLVSIIILAILIPVGFNANNGKTSAENYLLVSFFGITPQSAEVWGVTMWYDFVFSKEYTDLLTNGFGFQTILTPITNIVFLVSLSLLLFQIQGYVARCIRINKACYEWWNKVPRSEGNKEETK